LSFAARPVVVAIHAFRACRIGVSALLWGAVLLRSPWLAAATGVLLACSAAVGVERSPFVALWTATAGRWRPSAPVVLDRSALRFAHALGAILTLGAAALSFAAPTAGWWALVAVATLKTGAAAGGCSATKLYGCLAEGGCCTLASRRDG